MFFSFMRGFCRVLFFVINGNLEIQNKEKLPQEVIDDLVNTRLKSELSAGVLTTPWLNLPSNL